MDGKISPYYQALCARDSRFDGVFFVGVSSTGIYCRPVCPAQTPKEANCTFFPSAAAAEQASFRPCLRCRPELAPGYAPVDDSKRIATSIAAKVQTLALGEGLQLEELSELFQLSGRQIRRIVKKELGATPIQLLQTSRLLLAKQLLTETTLPVTDIAFASGYSSVRRFNDAFLKHYRLAPSRFRQKLPSTADQVSGESITLKLPYRPPLHWEALLDFLQSRRMAEVEAVEKGTYSRTMEMGERKGWVRISHSPTAEHLQAEISVNLLPSLSAVLEKLRQLFDLKANPTVISQSLGKHPRLAPSLLEAPGLRVPGAFDSFEIVLRAILGQQISVKAATTLASRFASRFGEAIDCPHPGLTRLTPRAQDVAQAPVSALQSLGLPKRRSETVLRVAQLMSQGHLQLSSGDDPKKVIPQLQAISGIGPWTANYIAMRVLNWPDAFPKEDAVLQKVLGSVKARQAEDMSQVWRPWRSYAVMHLWRQSSKQESETNS